jgi:hypothetical protein
MVWAVRTAGDATWAVTGSGKSLLEDENVQVFLTGDVVPDEEGSGSGGDVEMVTLGRERRKGRGVASEIGGRRRPDLKRIVDGVFEKGVEERVAVLVCGPEEMGRSLREAVGVWVRRGRVVWWHKEGFGF